MVEDLVVSVVERWFNRYLDLMDLPFDNRYISILYGSSYLDYLHHCHLYLYDRIQEATRI